MDRKHMKNNLREVLEYILEAEQNSFEEWIAEHGEDSPALENHIWQKAMNVWFEFGFDHAVEYDT